MSKSKLVYIQNVERIREFYESDYFRKIRNEENRLKKIISALYDDPDKYDRDLLDQAKQYGKKYGVAFSPDGICSWEMLFDVYGKNEEGRETADWLDKYEIIRESCCGTLYFPRRMGAGSAEGNGRQTINQYKGTH